MKYKHFKQALLFKVGSHFNNPKNPMKNQRKINLIVVHCSATRVNQDFPVEALEACHKARGFKSIGYHYYITKDGVVYPCRPETEVGAHV